MSGTDFYLEERLMELRVQEEQRRAELRRLQREVRGARPGWLSGPRCWLLCQLGSRFVSLGMRFLQAGLPEPLPAEE